MTSSIYPINHNRQAKQAIEQNKHRLEKTMAELMPHRQLIKRIQHYGLQTM